jgi:hypothetical protein
MSQRERERDIIIKWLDRNQTSKKNYIVFVCLCENMYIQFLY